MPFQRARWRWCGADPLLYPRKDLNTWEVFRIDRNKRESEVQGTTRKNRKGTGRIVRECRKEKGKYRRVCEVQGTEEEQAGK